MEVISTLVAVPKLLFLCSRTCCRDVGPNGPNNKHSLEEHLWHVASTTSTVASLRVPRPGWLPSQAKLPLRDGRRRTWQTLHCSWNVTSTIRKTRACPTQTWIALGKLVATYSFAASPFLRCMISTQVAVPKLWFSHNNGPNNKHSLEEHMWHVASTTSAVQQWHPCKWQD